MAENTLKTQPGSCRHWRVTIIALILFSTSCTGAHEPTTPILRWYVFNEPSGAFHTAAKQCSEAARGSYRIEMQLLPSDSDEQRIQLARRLAAKDSSIDIIGMDIIWTAEFAEAGWILPWPKKMAARAKRGRLQSTIESATYKQQLWAIPFTSNIQLLWYRSDYVQRPPQTWDELLQVAEALGSNTLQIQGARYEGLTVLFNSLLASAGGSILDESGKAVSLKKEPTEKALALMKRIAISPSSNPSLSIMREDETRLAFEAGSPLMINYTYVWPSARQNAPQIAAHMAWARWPAITEGQPSRVTLGGINLSIGAYSHYPDLALEAAICLASKRHQRLAAIQGGLLPTQETLYDDFYVQQAFPFAETLHISLKEAVQRPQSPVYTDISLAISRTLHPMETIHPQRDTLRLRKIIKRALLSQGLL